MAESFKCFHVTLSAPSRGDNEPAHFTHPPIRVRHYQSTAQRLKLWSSINQLNLRAVPLSSDGASEHNEWVRRIAAQQWAANTSSQMNQFRLKLFSNLREQKMKKRVLRSAHQPAVLSGTWMGCEAQLYFVFFQLRQILGPFECYENDKIQRNLQSKFDFFFWNKREMEWFLISKNYELRASLEAIWNWKLQNKK